MTILEATTMSDYIAEHGIEILIILSNLLLVVVTVLLSFITVMTVEHDRRVEVLRALHLAARESVKRRHRRILARIRRHREAAIDPGEDATVEI